MDHRSGVEKCLLDLLAAHLHARSSSFKAERLIVQVLELLVFHAFDPSVVIS